MTANGQKKDVGVSFDDSASPVRRCPPRRAQSLLSVRSSSSNISSVTYGAQNQLPPLPIPTLEETLAKFPKTVAPLQDEQEQEETRMVVEEFLNGDGPKLQEALLEYEREGRESGRIGSYIEEFWNETYLAADASVVLNLNPFFVLEDGPDPKIAKDQLRRAASICFASVKLASRLKHETMAPDVFRGQPLCMDQFKVLFGSSRQPVNRNGMGTQDDIHVYRDSSHVVVLCKNQFYYFPVLWPDLGHVAVDEADILDILNAIQKHADQLDPAEASREGLGVLTALPRSEWAQAREALCQTEANKDALHVIDSALFVLVLDDYEAPTIHAAAASMLHGSNSLSTGEESFQQGTCLNRWYDKLQLIVYKDGTCGINFEHSAVDGHTALRFVSDVFAETVITFAESITQLIHGRGKIPHVLEAEVERAATARDEEGRPVLDVFPKKLVFEFADSDIERIFFAETAVCDQIIACLTCVLEFKDYGKLLIVGNKISPDSFVQLSILLAYYKLYGKLVCVYEPVMTKSFYHGRTEAMRSATPEAKELCQIWASKTASSAAKLQALQRACKEHSRLVKEAAAGKGVDRHLFALNCIAQRKNMPTPAFFESKAWQTLNHTILSTSNCGNPALRLFGFGPVVPDGFGIGYVIKDSALSYVVTSMHRQTKRYVHTLRTILKEMQELLKPLSDVQVNQRPRLNEVTVGAPTTHIQSNYDDIFGESGFDESSMGVNDDSTPLSSPNSHTHKPKGKYFSTVKEQYASVPLLDMPKIHINVPLELEKKDDDSSQD